MNIKKGDVLKVKKYPQYTRTVLAVIKDLYFVSYDSNERGYGYAFYTLEGLKETFELPEEKWVPSMNEKGFYIGETSRGELVVYTSFFDNKEFLDKKVEQNNYFKDYKEAEAKLAEMLKVLQA